MRGLLHSRRAPRVLGLGLSAFALLAAPASACPSCSLGQGLDTLMIILGFMVVPYVVVSCVWLWMRRLLNSE